MIPYYFTLSFSCLLFNKRWTCWIFLFTCDMTVFVHLPIWHILFSLTFYQENVTRHLPSTMYRWCISWFVVVLFWTTWSFVVFFSQYQVVKCPFWSSQLVTIVNFLRSFSPFNLFLNYIEEKRDIVWIALVWTDYINNIWISSDDEIWLSSQFSVSSFLMNLRRHYPIWLAAIYHLHMISSFTNKQVSVSNGLF